MAMSSWFTSCSPRILATLLAAAAMQPGLASAQTWTGGGDGVTWDDAANWSTGVVPDAMDASANIAVGGPLGVNVLNPVSVGSIVLSGRGGVSLINPAGGNGSLVFDVSAGNATLRATGIVGTFTHTIAAPIVLMDDLDITTTLNIRLLISGSITGGGGLIKNGSEVLFLTGVNSYTGGTTINGGTLQVNGSSLTGNVLNNAALDILQTSNTIYSGTISGSGAIFKRGAGTLNLTGTNPFSGRTIVTEGELRVDGSLAGTIILRSPSSPVLSGTGSVGTLIVGSGTVSPGAGIGTLTVNGNAQFLAGSALRVEVDPSGTQNADRLAVGGAVTGLNNLAIRIDPLVAGVPASAYVAANDYVVLTGSSIDAGAPILVEGGDLPALVDVGIVGQPSTSGQVALRFVELPVQQLPSVPAVTSSNNPNHAALVAAVGNTAATPGSQLLTNGTSVASAVNSLTNNQLAQFNGVHAEPYSSHLTVGLEHMDMVSGVVLDRASGERPQSADRAAPARNRVWIDVGDVNGRVKGAGGVGSFGYDMWNLTLGADIYAAKRFTGGFFVGGGRSRMDEHDAVEQTFDTQSAFAGLYGHYEFDSGIKLSSVAGYSHGDTDTERNNPTIGNFTGGVANADFDSHAYFVGAKARRDFDYNGLVVTPSAGVTYAYIRQDGVSEQGGGDFNYDIDSAAADSLVTSIGIDLARPIISGGSSWSPRAFARYEFDWMANSNPRHDVNVSSPIFGRFDQVGQNRGEHGLVVGAGLTYQHLDTLGLDVSYAYSNRSNSAEHSVGANLKFRF